MKKFIFSLLVLLTSVSHAFADGQSAMLQQGDSTCYFYGPTALSQAYEAADTTGAVITLSSGYYGTLTVKKNNLTIIGNYGLTLRDNETTILKEISIEANNVVVDGLYVQSDFWLRDGIRDCKVLHSHAYYLNSPSKIPHYNTIIDQCCVTGHVIAYVLADNMIIKNSTIKCFYNNSLPVSPICVMNCVVYEAMCNLPSGVYKNNIFWARFDSNRCPATNEYYYNLIIGNNGNLSGCPNVEGNTAINSDSVLVQGVYPAYPINPGLGMDGTVRGPLGGTGFSEYPNIPHISKRIIDSYVDEKGELKVKIVVKAK